jgi:DNA polymerase-3 subunit delta
MPKLNALDYLSKPRSHPARPVCVVFGDDPFLQRQVVGHVRREVLGEEDGQFSLTVMEGRGAVLRDVLGEVATLAMFGPARRLVVVERADDFVSRYRAELEDYVAAPSPSGVLVLQVKSLPANTRLYKAVAAEGMAVDCNTPPPGRLSRWLSGWAKSVHHVRLGPAATEMLLEMVGPESGLLDQELAKLALTAGDGGEITAEAVEKLAGTWRTKTTWEMLDAALDGKVREALVQLDRLLLAGENPIAILGQISASLRRFAAATRLILQAEAAGRRIALGPALEQAGIKRFVLEKAQRQLRKLGRHRGNLLYRWLLATDLELKGASALPPRLVLERLVVQIAAPAPSPPSPRVAARGLKKVP